MKRVLLALIALMVCVAPAFAQKEKVKTKNKDKRFETVVKPAAEYAGHYIGFESDYYIDVSVDGAGNLSVTSVEGARRAQLRDIKLESGHLTATKVYEDGRTRPFTATFANRILNGVSIFGLLVEEDFKIDESTTLNRVFYKRQ